jgi:hypothetical protein
VHSQTKELAISHECVGVNNSFDVLHDAAVNIMIINGLYFSSHAITLVTFHVLCITSSTNLIVSTLAQVRRAC